MTSFIWQWPRKTTTFSPRTWYRVKHGSQPFGSKKCRWDKSLAWCESLPVYLVYLCHPTKCGPVTFLASLGGLNTAASFLPRRESQIWLTVGAVMESWPFLNLQSLVVLGGKWLPFSLVGGVPTFVKELPLVAYKWIPLQHDKEAAMSDQVVYIISCQGFCAHKEWPYPEFQFTATDFVLMAAKTSKGGDIMSEANHQANGLVERPAQGAADWQETEENSSPRNSPMWSPVWRPPTGCLNTNYCLEIWVTLTDELGDIPPPLHAWMAPVVEDMLGEARDGLTEAVVFGPGRAILFYWETFHGRGSKGGRD